MTAIFYPDCEAVSPNGRYLLEARSPYNGSINHRDGSAPPEDDFSFRGSSHQNEFRYRLIDVTRSQLPSPLVANDGGAVVWERWQEQGEESPHELVVSDEGWSILRTHGFGPEVIAVSREGNVVIRVGIGGPNDEPDEEAVGEQSLQRVNSPVWHAVHRHITTAGIFWTRHSWRYFFSVSDVDYFAWRTSWGQRLVIDLTNATLLDDEQPGDSVLSVAMRESEIQAACALLLELASQHMEIQRLVNLRRENLDAEKENPLLEKVRYATFAIHLAGVHRVARCVPFLRCLEWIDCVSSWTGSHAMDHGWSVEAQSLRPILHHTLRLLGEEPQGYATCHFTKDGERFPIPERIPARRERVVALNLSMPPAEVLRLLGAPDYIRGESHKVGKKNYRWTEDWEYDFRLDEQWVTLRITSEQVNRKGRIVRFEEVPSPWLHSDQREADILDW